MTITNKQLGEKIRELRTQAKLNQEDLAFKAKIDYSFLNQIENGKRNPTLQTLNKIAEALGTTVEKLLSF